MGGQTRRLHAPISRAAPSAGGCEYHTAISTAFQLELANTANTAELTATAAKCRLSTTRRHCRAVFRVSRV